MLVDLLAGRVCPALPSKPAGAAAAEAAARNHVESGFRRSATWRAGCLRSSSRAGTSASPAPSGRACARRWARRSSGARHAFTRRGQQGRARQRRHRSRPALLRRRACRRGSRSRTRRRPSAPAARSTTRPPDLRHPFRAATWVGGLSPEAELLDLHWRPIKSLKAGAGNSARVHILCRKNCSGFRRRPSSRGPPAHRSTGPGPSARFVCFRHGDRRGTLPPTRATPVWHGGQPEARTAVAL